jgi:hypothetical protein
VVGAQIRNVYSIETGSVGQADLIVVRCSVTSNSVRVMVGFVFQGIIAKVLCL